MVSVAMYESGYDGSRSREAVIERELEKQRIRQEILAEAATMRRRQLEAEVRIELMMERERRRDYEQWQQHGHSSFYHRHTQIERIGLPRYERLHDYPMFGGYEGLPLSEAKTLCEASHSYSVLWHRSHEAGLPLELATRPKAEYRSGLLPPLSSGYGEIEGKKDELPFQRGPAVQPRKTELVAAKSLPKVINVIDEEKTIFSGKPRANHSGIKRKDVPSPVGPCGDTKKHKEEWRCDLCGITATSEMGLKDHTTGKKHKTKVGQKAGKIGLSSVTTISNPLINPSQVSEKAAVSSLSNAVVEKSQQTSSANQINANMERINEISIGKKRYQGPLQKKRTNKKKLWCKICGISAYSETVMTDHTKGKKHLSRVNELNTKNNEAGGTQMVDKSATN